MMFQTRVFTFTLSNPSLTALNYQWQIMDKAGNLDTSGGFPTVLDCGSAQTGCTRMYVNE
jgi:hypothetical protein